MNLYGLAMKAARFFSLSLRFLWSRSAVVNVFNLDLSSSRSCANPFLSSSLALRYCFLRELSSSLIPSVPSGACFGLVGVLSVYPFLHFQTALDQVNKQLDEANKSGEKAYFLGLSLGFGSFDYEHSETIDALLKEADSNLYREKARKKQGKS